MLFSTIKQNTFKKLGYKIPGILVISGIISISSLPLQLTKQAAQAQSLCELNNINLPVFNSHQQLKNNNNLSCNNINLMARNSNDLYSLETLVNQQINKYRQSHNLPPLKLDENLSQQARIHSQNMAQGNLPFGHEGFDKRMQVVNSKISFLSAAENVAYNQGYSKPVDAAVKGWIKSPGHHENMIGNYNLTGVGVAVNAQGEYYFTQIFVLENN